MRRNAVAVVTTVSAAMLGAGWAAGVIGASANSSQAGISIDALGGGSGVVGTTGTPTASDSTAPSPTPGATTTTDTAAAPAPTPVPAPAPAGVSGTFDGALVNTKEGPFQAEIVVSNNAITAVNVLVGGDRRGESRDINSYALPTLQDRVLSAQTWEVQGISGASYTVQGFLTSVKDAMTQAGLA